MAKMNIPDGEIKLGTSVASYLGFTPDKFEGYLWRRANRITISLIISRHPGQGNLSCLFERILSLGYEVAVPTPSNRMCAIVKAKGFVQTWEWSDLFEEDAELWVKTSTIDREAIMSGANPLGKRPNWRMEFKSPCSHSTQPRRDDK